MAEFGLWQVLGELKDRCRFIELSYELSANTVRWPGFPPLRSEVLSDYPDGSLVHKVEVVTQYGTHVDAPGHFVRGARMLNELHAEELILPLCVLDISQKARLCRNRR